ncbi:MAG: DoxX family protein [Planctomycetota bacterium]|nr:DoxX family protein [Planctomycetota bacterium]
MNKASLTISWICRLIAAFLMGMTLYFKFTGQPLPVAIFTTLDVEPWGRYFTGCAEAVAVVLLILPWTVPIGALFTLGILGGAIICHLTVIGVNLEGIKANLPAGSKDLVPDTSLFIYACIGFICGIIILVLHKNQLIRMIKRKKARG